MSIAFRTKRVTDATKSWQKLIAPTPVVETEAPEQAYTSSEAPELRTRSVEAPDAGEGRRHHYEQEFTHGRSQS